MYNPFVFREPEEKRSFVLEPAEKNIKPVRDYIIGRDLSENEKYSLSIIVRITAKSYLYCKNNEKSSYSGENGAEIPIDEGRNR